MSVARLPSWIRRRSPASPRRSTARRHRSRAVEPTSNLRADRHHTIDGCCHLDVRHSPGQRTSCSRATAKRARGARGLRSSTAIQRPTSACRPDRLPRTAPTGICSASIDAMGMASTYGIVQPGTQVPAFHAGNRGTGNAVPVQFDYLWLCPKGPGVTPRRCGPCAPAAHADGRRGRCARGAPCAYRSR